MNITVTLECGGYIVRWPLKNQRTFRHAQDVQNWLDTYAGGQSVKWEVRP